MASLPTSVQLLNLAQEQSPRRQLRRGFIRLDDRFVRTGEQSKIAACRLGSLALAIWCDVDLAGLATFVGDGDLRADLDVSSSALFAIDGDFGLVVPSHRDVFAVHRDDSRMLRSIDALHHAIRRAGSMDNTSKSQPTPEP